MCVCVCVALSRSLLQFNTDVRPPYFGTWRKKSTAISGRHPMKRDTGLFDYEYDSEAEWEPEDEESGDECHSSDDEEDEQDGPKV